MSAVIELTLMGLDCFSFIVEPFVGGILARLGFETGRRRKMFGHNRCCSSWRRSFCEYQQVEGKENQDISLADDIDKFCEWHKAFMKHTRNERLALTEEAKHMIRAKWDWILLHMAISDPTDGQLNWLGYDLGLIADWDLPELAPKLGRPFGSLADISDDSERLDDPTFVEMEAIISGSADRKIFLAIRQREAEISPVDSRQDHGLKRQQIGAKMNSFLHVKWLTLDEYRLYITRSSLVFYYTQHYPQLTNLYLLVSSLLEEAGLIESSCVSQSRRLPPALGDKNHHLARLGIQNKPELDRYALVLMLVAYLTDKSASTSKRAHSLSQSLVGFLAAYGKPLTEGWRVSVEQSGTIRQWQDGHRHLELVKTQEVSKGAQLAVLDPVLSSHKSIEICDAGEPGMPRSANLTENFSRASEMGQLFARLLDYLEGTESSQKNASHQRPLCRLFTVCDSGRDPHSLKQPDAFASGSQCDRKPAVLSAASGSRETPANQDEILSGNSFTIRSSRRGTTPKVLANILFLAVFLLLRNILLNYLEQVKFDLKDQAREDLVDLKHALFENKPANGGIPPTDPSEYKTDMLDQQESSGTPDNEPDNSRKGAENRDETNEMLSDLYSMLLMRALSNEVGLDLQELMPLMTGEQEHQAGSGLDESDQRTKISQLLSELDGELGDFPNTLAASRPGLKDELGNRQGSDARIEI